MIETISPDNSASDGVGRAEFRLLVERNADGILVVDRAGLVRFANPAAEAIFGRSAAELVGAPIGVPVVAGEVAEITVLRPRGGKAEAEIQVVETSWAGEPMLLASVRDVTRRRAQDAERHQVQKMEAIGQLTAGVAHDFNNILTSVLGNLELAAAASRDPRLDRLLTNAMRSAERAARLTSHLLAFARKQGLRVCAVDLNALVDDAEELLTRSLDPSITLVTAPAADLWPALADPTQLELMLLNLVINARDAMPTGGVVRVETRNHPTPTAQLVALMVADTGVGMMDEVKARAFDPFFTTKEVGKGSGLGLSMVYGVARQLGGSVQIDSAANAGTTVTVLLPRAAQPAMAAQADRRSARRGAGRLLVVDDDPDVRAVAAAALIANGYTVIEAKGRPDGLATLERGEPVDLMITDLAMPGLRGAELIRAARAIRPSLPVLVITGYDGTHLPEPLLAQGLLRKPFRAADLAAKVEDCLRAAPSSIEPVR